MSFKSKVRCEISFRLIWLHFHNFLPSVLNYVPHVTSCPTSLTCLTCLRALRARMVYVPACLRAFASCVPSFFYVPLRAFTFWSVSNFCRALCVFAFLFKMLNNPMHVKKMKALKKMKARKARKK